MTKNLLMITSTFPPQEDVGGLRPAMFAKYLPLFKWRPIILTRTYPHFDANYKTTLTGISGLPPDDDIVSIEMATDADCVGHDRLSDKVTKFIKPEYGRSWNLIEQMINTFLASRHAAEIDAIYATSPDFASIAVGVLLGNKLNVPVVVDFRDVVEQDEHLGFRPRLLFYRHIARRYWLTRKAKHALVVSNEHQAILSRRLTVPVSVIVNGYDHEMFKAMEGVRSQSFKINYVGRILGQWLRDPSVFFMALDYLMEDQDVDLTDIEVNFVGTEENLLNSILVQYKCKEFVKIHPRIDYEKVPEQLGCSCINLVLTNKNRTGVLTTKFFEYLAVKRPILCVPSDDGALDSIIRKTQSGLSSSEPLQVYNYIKELYIQWKRSEGELPVIESVSVEQYSRKHLTRDLATLLDSSIENSRTSSSKEP